MKSRKKYYLKITGSFISIGFVIGGLFLLFTNGSFSRFIEIVSNETPQAKVIAYLENIKDSDAEKALEVWRLIDRAESGLTEDDRLLKERRMNLTKNLIESDIKDYEIREIEWWSTCCEPNIINDPRGAGGARIYVRLTDDNNDEYFYFFDVFVEGGYWGATQGYPIRHWILRDIYPSDQKPLYWKLSTADNALATEIAESEDYLYLNPRQIMEVFLEADSLGFRLGGRISKQLSAIQNYFRLSSGFPTGFHFEGDFAMVIKNYEIINEYASENNEKYYVEVKYFCEKGAASGSMGLEEETKEGPFAVVPCSSFFQAIWPLYFENPNEYNFMEFDLNENSQVVTFKLIKDNDQWKINSPSICPHISEETFQNHLESFN